MRHELEAAEVTDNPASVRGNTIEVVRTTHACAHA